MCLTVMKIMMVQKRPKKIGFLFFPFSISLIFLLISLPVDTLSRKNDRQSARVRLMTVWFCICTSGSAHEYADVKSERIHIHSNLHILHPDL